MLRYTGCIRVPSAGVSAKSAAELNELIAAPGSVDKLVDKLVNDA